jgi:hypothetical protein
MVTKFVKSGKEESSPRSKKRYEIENSELVFDRKTEKRDEKM